MYYKTHLLQIKLDTGNFKRLEIPKFIWLYIKAIATYPKYCSYWESICGTPISKFIYIINPTINSDNLKEAPYHTDYELEIKSPQPEIPCNDIIWLCGRGEVIVKYQTLENERVPDQERNA